MSEKNIREHVAGFVVKKALDYLDENPDQAFKDLLGWADKFDKGDLYIKQRNAFREVLNKPDSNWYQLIRSIFSDIDPDVRKVLFENFIVNSALFGSKKQIKSREKYQCNIPWAILLDPTTACNLKCTGCWAAEYGHQLNLSLETMDDIIRQGKALGTYMYIYTGGEPMVRKNDLIKLCEKHSDCVFLAFTNGTLIDEKFADEMLRVKNFVPAISIEGNEEVTDARRGNGTYQAAIKAMQLLKDKKLPFGVSCCYTSQNVDSISSETFVDFLIDAGAKFAWFFHYMPVGNGAVTSLLPTPKQHEMMLHRIREYRNTKAIFTIDFQNDGEYVRGCIAGGRNYLHINANGDIEPCVFIHYSDSNIYDKTLVEAFQSPLFMAYKEGQPFNNNHLRPCPMLENPEKLRNMVHKTNAHSTDLMSPESVDHLCDKCKEYAKNWENPAQKLWEVYHQNKECDVK